MFSIVLTHDEVTLVPANQSDLMQCHNNYFLLPSFIANAKHGGSVKLVSRSSHGEVFKDHVIVKQIRLLHAVIRRVTSSQSQALYGFSRDLGKVSLWNSPEFMQGELRYKRSKIRTGIADVTRLDILPVFIPRFQLIVSHPQGIRVFSGNS